MELFGFVRDVGRRLFDDEAEAAERIRQHILADNPGVEDLDVGFADGIARLEGRCTRHGAFEKSVLMAGNVLGVADVEAAGLEPFIAPKPEEIPVTGTHRHAHETPQRPPEEYYLIERGDTLESIARRYYGDAADWRRLFDANREVVQDPAQIFPGQKIRVPID